MRILHQKLDLHTDTSLDKFKQTALVSTFLHLLEAMLGYLDLKYSY